MQLSHGEDKITRNKHTEYMKSHTEKQFPTEAFSRIRDLFTISTQWTRKMFPILAIQVQEYFTGRTRRG